MSFIKTVPNHWKPTDFDYSDVALAPSMLHITKTIGLLESRCDDYAEYLRAIFRNRAPEWNAGIDRWNFEECQHGHTLRALSEAACSDFEFDTTMGAYESLVSYHEATGESVRGSVGAEMVSRCVVEALASTLYRVLADASSDPTSQAIYTTLAQDEARHFGMFNKMLEAEAKAIGGFGVFARLRCALQRVLELEDSQIMVASCVVAGRSAGHIRSRREANWYLGKLYPLYRWKHLRYAGQMLLRTLGLHHSRLLVTPLTLVLWIGVKLRGAWAILCSRLMPPSPAV